MRKIIFCLMVMIAFTAVPALGAGGHDDHGHHGHGHDHSAELSKAQVIEKASGYVVKLIKKGKLDASWEFVPAKEAKENSAHEWVVTFSNSDIEDPEKQILYMFLTLSGKYIAANFTGK